MMQEEIKNLNFENQRLANEIESVLRREVRTLIMVREQLKSIDDMSKLVSKEISHVTSYPEKFSRERLNTGSFTNINKDFFITKTELELQNHQKHLNCNKPKSRKNSKYSNEYFSENNKRTITKSKSKPKSSHSDSIKNNIINQTFGESQK